MMARRKLAIAVGGSVLLFGAGIGVAFTLDTGSRPGPVHVQLVSPAAATADTTTVAPDPTSTVAPDPAVTTTTAAPVEVSPTTVTSAPADTVAPAPADTIPMNTTPNTIAPAPDPTTPTTVAPAPTPATTVAPSTPPTTLSICDVIPAQCVPHSG